MSALITEEKIEEIIAKAVIHCINDIVPTGRKSRLFIRLDDFNERVYQQILSILRNRPIINNHRLIIRSIQPIKGFDSFTIESDRSATWYRNHLQAGECLILVFNRRASDAQSLKDLYTINNITLVHEQLAALIEASIQLYQYSQKDQEKLTDFINKSLKSIGVEPQLYDLVRFFISIDQYLNNDYSIEKAIALSLPHLRLFRCYELAHYLNTPRGKKLLREIHGVARIGFEIVEESQRKKWLDNLKNAQLNDDGENKRQLLRDFINGELINQPDRLHRVFQIDWEEVRLIIQPRRSTINKQDIIQALRETQQSSSASQTDIDDLIHELQRDAEPDATLIETVLRHIGEDLSAEIRTALRRLRRPRTTRNTDFLHGMMTLLTEMMDLRDSKINPRISVEYLPEKARRKKAGLTEAARAFRCMYGGIEQVIPAIQCDLDELWRLAQQAVTEEDDDDETSDQDRKVTLRFRITIRDTDGKIHESAELEWEYRADSPIAATVAALDTERATIQSDSLGPMFDAEPARLRIPVYQSAQSAYSISDIDLHQPFQTLGRWFDNAGDMRQMFLEKSRGMDDSVVQPLQALSALEQTWASFVQGASDGLLHDTINVLVQQYESFLAKALSHFTKSQHLTLYRVINQAWMLKPSDTDSWVIMPLLHPLKLKWWRQRAITFNTLIERMFSNVAHAVDHRILQREIGTVYSSLYAPPALTFSHKGQPGQWLVAIDETLGYTLFRQPQNRESTSSDITGFNFVELAEDEQEIEQSQAVTVLSSIVQDYFETYPFARDGLTIVLLECKHSALPIMLIKRLSQQPEPEKATLPQRIHLTVHTSKYGAALYRRIDEWLSDEAAQIEREGAAYLPRITVDVLECALDDAIQQTSRSDLVILVDFFAENCQELRPKIHPNQHRHSDSMIYPYQIKPEPFKQGEIFREILLTPTAKSDISRLFLLCQYAGGLTAGSSLPALSDTIDLYATLSLDSWQDFLQKLHQHFNWVICYDRAIDRLLLRSTCQNQVHVIRYATGLGAQRLHHLTISSAGRTQEIVAQRLAAQLEPMLPRLSPDQRARIANHLAERANQVSGDIVLRAAGPGVFLNELIGLVAAIFETEQTFNQQHPDSLKVWILLDDFQHWFSGRKKPDLLFIGMYQTDDQPVIELQIIETKCVNVGAFEKETRDARLQVRSGVSRLINAFRPGKEHLDALYWYDQLYRAIAGNVQLTDEQHTLWSAVSNSLIQGNFQLVASGHSWIFCYDGQAGVTNGADVRLLEERASAAPEVPLHEHRYGQRELVNVLRALIQTTSVIEQEQTLDWSLSHNDKTEELPNFSTYDDELLQAQSVANQDTPPFPNPGAAQAQQLSPKTGDTQRPNDIDMSQSAQLLTHTIPPVDRGWLQQKAAEIEQALRVRDVRLYPIEVDQAEQGPSIVRFKLRLKPNQQLSKIQVHAKDLARELKLQHPPFIDNIPGTNFVGFDIPRESPAPVYLQPILAQMPQPKPAELPIIVGISPKGDIIIEDLSDFPHLLVAGATGSGKSVFLRNLLLSLLAVYQPGQLELLIIDPKQTDFTIFSNLPHLRGGKVISDIKSAREALLELARREMPHRQQALKNRGVMKIKKFNQRYPAEALPPIVAIIDEYALLKSQMDKKEQEAFEQDLSKLAAAARSVGIHLVVATQRPSADVITSTIKANLDARVALRVASSVNSRVVLDESGAENLLGQGDMLFRRSDGGIIRLQAPFIDEDDIIPWLSERFGLR